MISLQLRKPVLADEFVWREAFECPEPLGEVVGVDELREVTTRLRVSVVVEAPDGGVFVGAVHALNLVLQLRFTM